MIFDFPILIFGTSLIRALNTSTNFEYVGIACSVKLNGFAINFIYVWRIAHRPYTEESATLSRHAPTFRTTRGILIVLHFHQIQSKYLIPNQATKIGVEYVCLLDFSLIFCFVESIVTLTPYSWGSTS